MESGSKFRKTFVIRPLEHLYDLSYSAANQNLQFAAFPSMNIIMNQKSARRRPGYTLDRTLTPYENPQILTYYKIRSGTEFTLYITDKNIIKIETATGKTYTYLTPIYTTGTISSLNVAKTVVTGSSTDWQNATGRPAAGDYFAINLDLTLDEELNAAWTKIKSVDSATQITLDSAYLGSATSGAYRIRKVYSVPIDERWSYAIVGDKFCFTNGNENVQYWSGTTTDIATATRAVSSNVATITTATAHGMSAGDSAVVSGMGDSTYDGIFIILSTPLSTSFTYSLTHANETQTGDTAGKVSECPMATDLHPNYAVKARHALNYANRLFLADCYLGQSVASAHRAVSSNVATIGTSAAHNLSAAETTVISGMSDSGYNGTFAVASVPDTTHFTYNLVHADEAETPDTTGTITADLIREPWTLKWSKEGDPTNWTDSTSGENDFIGTESFIAGLGKLLNNIVVYKRDSLIFGYRTGDPTSPVTFPQERIGIGCIASHSIVHAYSTNFFLGNDDFYMLNGDAPESIGGPIRDKFFSIVLSGEREKIWGHFSEQYKLIMWFADTTTDGQLAFIYDYQNKQWGTFSFHNRITGLGEKA